MNTSPEDGVYSYTKKKKKKKKSFFDSLREGYSNPTGFKTHHSEIFEARLEECKRVLIQNI